jgi:hypothetical protein
MTWYEHAVQAANRIQPAHTSPWKLASTYALLSIAESLLPPVPSSARCQSTEAEALLTTAEVAEMARLPVATLRYWRHRLTRGQARSSWSKVRTYESASACVRVVISSLRSGRKKLRMSSTSSSGSSIGATCPPRRSSGATSTTMSCPNPVLTPTDNRNRLIHRPWSTNPRRQRRVSPNAGAVGVRQMERRIAQAR